MAIYIFIKNNLIVENVVDILHFDAERVGVGQIEEPDSKMSFVHELRNLALQFVF